MTDTQYRRKQCRAWIHRQLSELYAGQLAAVQRGDPETAWKLKREIVCWTTALSLDDLIHEPVQTVSEVA